MIRVKGPILVIGEPIYDGTILSLEAAERLINEFNENPNTHLGEFLNCNFQDTNLQNVSHKIVKVTIEGKYVMAEMEILDTPQGKIIQDIFNSDGNLFGSASLLRLNNDITAMYTINVLDHNYLNKPLKLVQNITLTK